MTIFVSQSRKKVKHLKHKAMRTFLTEANINDFIGKKVRFFAPSADGNESYTGVAIIKGIDPSRHFPLDVEHIEGDTLSGAFFDSYYRDNGSRVFSYSDDDRYVSVEILK